MARAAELVEAARILVAAGRWERADALLAPDQDNPDVVLALAESSVDAALWRRGSARGAASDRAADRLVGAARQARGADDVATRLLALRLRYQRLADEPVDREGGRALVADLSDLAEQTCADCDPTSGWNAYYLALVHDNLLDDPQTAAPLYAEAEKQARLRGDRLAESYPVRQLAEFAAREGRAVDALELAYHSLALRQAAGAAPAVAAQQIQVAQFELADGGARRAVSALLEAAEETARALDLPPVAQLAAGVRRQLAA
jgi:hypothetical protein